MNHEAAIRILERIQTSEGDLKADLILRAVRYARLRTDWQLTAPAERRAMDSARTVAHNALVDAANILSRAMVKVGEDATWRDELGDDRRKIGDWACHIHARLGIEAR